MKVIDKFREKYYFLSNLYPATQIVDGYKFKDNETYYQSQKATNQEDFLKILSANNPKQAKYFSRLIKTRKDWKEISIEVIRKGLNAKFTQNKELAKKLIETYPTKLIEGNTWNDTFWGVCNGKGENWLGKLLTELRKELLVKINNTKISGKTIIAGSRNFTNQTEANRVLDKLVLEGYVVPTEIISGKARGADTCGEIWAKTNGIPIKEFPSYWEDLNTPTAIIKINKYGKRYNANAGYERNKRMAEYSNALIAFWNGKSPGTKNMIELAKKKKLHIFIYNYTNKTLKIIRGE
jgi:ribA/ribD-fused uncharacterized protein